MRERKKILHLITGLEMGGTEHMLLKTLPYLQKDFDNRVGCIKGRGLVGKMLREKGVPVYFLDLRSILDAGVVGRFKRVVDEFEPDLLVTYLIHADLFGRFWGRIFGIKKIVSSQRGSLLDWQWLRVIDRLTAFLVDRYIVQTKVAKGRLIRVLGLPAERLVVIPNGVDLGGYSLKDGRRGKLRDLGILNSNINLVYVGVLRRGKGLERLLRVFEKLYQSRPGVNLLIVGEGELGQELRRQCRDYLSRKNIYFLGFRRDVREILLVSDIFVLATEAEGMSNAILEAMASGLPMVTTNIEENREILNDEKEALLVEMTNERQLFLALTRLAEDRGLRLSLANNARNKVKDYNLELISRRLGEFFRSVVSGQ